MVMMIVNSEHVIILHSYSLNDGTSQCSRIGYVFYVFFRFQKTWLFTFFWNDVSKSRKKSQKVSSLLNVYRNFGLKTAGCYGYLQAFVTDSSQLHSFFVSTLLTFWARCLMLVSGDRDLPVLTSGNWVVKAEWLNGLWIYMYVFAFLTFFSKSKNMTFYVFLVVPHVFSNTGTSFHAYVRYLTSIEHDVLTYRVGQKLHTNRWYSWT